MTSNNTARVRASLELLAAAALWGFGFVAAVWALKVMTAYQLTFVRFFIAALFGLFFFFRADLRLAMRESFGMSFAPAVLLTGTLVLQTVGLQYTTATKSGFITTLYVVIIPVMDWLMKGRRLPLKLWLCVLTALIGTAMIVRLGVSDFNIGDMLTLACAVFAAAQIQVLGEISPNVRRPFVFNIVQSAWAALLCFPLLFLAGAGADEPEVSQWPIESIIGVLSLAFGSTVLAFYLQVRAQARLSTTISSLFFIMESPFAMLFAVIFLGESLGLIESFGAVLIFLSAAAASLIEAQRKKF